MPHKGHDNKPTRKPQRILRGQDGATERRYGLQIYRDVAPVNATCYAIVAGQRQQSQRFSFSYSHSLSTSPSPALVPRSRLLCSCHFYSYLLALAIPCCFSIIYVIDISTPSFRTVFRRQRLRPTHTPPSHTLQFIVAINWAPALSGSQSILFTAFVLRNHCLVPSCVHHRFRDEMRWSSAANLMH